MRIRRKPWARPELEACDFCVKDLEAIRGKWNDSFVNKNPLHLELGCGKGGFIAQISALNQNINYVAIDIKSEMSAYARRKIVASFEEKGIEKIENVKLLVHNIENIHEVFSEEDRVERIYINFCNPWPRGKHKKRRLTYPKKLAEYRKFLCDTGEIWFKTDDDELFEESIEYFNESGYSIEYITRDLHNSGFEYNIETEHEKMFSDMGIKIKFLIAKK
ncbi:MAG: tRNA (guanosine(46)-N7)-methyltransferase TrmB [Oscillospiraceae bacterium]|nr:tRNA (guanosine(46)-N7)-methyltransferase TrmB [Oscillospiraceae bacterium]MBQ9981816.1 tRNA (guanosine(46)-N7)-methyltransferase TrmB [Oscillospiraceae bacterium]